MSATEMPAASSAYAYPLLIKQLLHTPMALAPDREIVYRDQVRYRYRDFRGRLDRLASALARLGVKAGSVVAVMDWDSHRYLECYFAVPMMGATLLTVNVRLANGEPASAETAVLPITVNSVIPPGENPTDVRDLKPQVSLPGGSGIARRAVALIVAAVALTLAAALLLIRWLRRPRVAAAPLPQAPPSPESIARAELDRIAALGLLDRGDLKQFHALLAACTRRYLSDRYHFHAYAMTTTELRRHMGNYGVDRWQARLVTGLLTESDAVNFAQYVPARTRCEANLEMAYQIVDAGEPVVELPPAPAAPAPA